MLTCYGHHGSKQECRDCEYVSWCKDAKDPAPRGYVSFESIEYAEEYAEPVQETSNEEGLERIFAELFARIDCKHQSRPMLRFIRRIVEEALDHPKTMAIALAKIACPSTSYSVIGQKFGCDKQLIQYHLRKAEQLIPGIDAAFLVDRRFNQRHYAPNSTNLTHARKIPECEADLIRRKMAQARMLRIENGITLREISKKTGISYSLIRSYELGQVTPRRLSRAQRILDALENMT